MTDIDKSAREAAAQAFHNARYVGSRQTIPSWDCLTNASRHLVQKYVNAAIDAYHDSLRVSLDEIETVASSLDARWTDPETDEERCEPTELSTMLRSLAAHIKTRVSAPKDVEQLCKRLQEVGTTLHRPPSIQSMSNIRLIEACDEAAAMLRQQADRADLMRNALEPFARFAETHDGPHGLVPDLGEDYTWLRPSPGYPPIRTKHFRDALAALKENPDADH